MMKSADIIIDIDPQAVGIHGGEIVFKETL